MLDKKTYIELDYYALLNNISAIKKIIGPTKLSVVVKSNAYGHGTLEISQALDNNQEVSMFCTAGLSEAIYLRKSGIKKSIIALSYLDYDYQEAIINNIICTIYNYSDAIELNNAAKEINKIAKIHIKIDSGMCRLGVNINHAIDFIEAIKKLDYIKLEGIFTHLSDTQNPDTSFSDWQLDNFNNLLDKLEHLGIFLQTHAISSSGLYINTKRQYNLIRAGSAIYGLVKSPEHYNLIKAKYPDFNLKPIMTWKTHIIQIKQVPAGSSVGYDRTYVTNKQSTIAILPIGYFEGYKKCYSNCTFVEINGYKAQVIGSISMNLTAIDITNIPDITTYSPVTIISPDSFNSVLEYLKYSKISSNEITTSINSNITRNINYKNQLTQNRENLCLLSKEI